MADEGTLLFTEVFQIIKKEGKIEYHSFEFMDLGNDCQ